MNVQIAAAMQLSKWIHVLALLTTILKTGQAGLLNKRLSKEDDDTFSQNHLKFATYLVNLVDTSGSHVTMTFAQEDETSASMVSDLAGHFEEARDDVTVGLAHFDKLRGKMSKKYYEIISCVFPG